MRLTFLLAAAISAPVHASTVQNLDQCNNDAPHSILENASYDVVVYYPNSKPEPDIWQGPICAWRKSDGGACLFSESLIKSVSFSNTNELSVTTFSGSNTTHWKIDLNTCKTIYPNE